MSHVQKNHQTKKAVFRSSRSVVKDPPEATKKWYYNSFTEPCKRVHTLKSISGRNLQELKEHQGSGNHSLPPILQQMVRDFTGWKQLFVDILTINLEEKNGLVNLPKILETKCSSPDRPMRGSRLQPFQ